MVFETIEPENIRLASSPRNDSTDKTGFVMAFEFENTFDLSGVAKGLPDGIAISSPKLVAGVAHVNEILIQAKECWHRNQQLARSKSIDLLMRITCKGQISEAIASSGITNANSIVIFGFAKDKSQIQTAVELISTVAGVTRRSDHLLEMSREKSKFLREFHKLPKWFNDNQILVALKEKSVLLVFAK